MLDGNVLKVIPTGVLEKFYDDAISPSARKLGKVSAGMIEAFTYLLDPAIKALIDYPDRIERDLAAVCESVPPERRVEAAPEVAGPVLQNLRFISNENKLRDLYLNLLRASIDTNTKASAHPAFVKVIERISSFDAFVFWNIKKLSPISFEIGKGWYSDGFDETAALHLYLKLKVRSHAEIVQVVEILKSLGLIQIVTPPEVSPDIEAVLALTRFGKRFSEICLPDTFEYRGSLSEPMEDD